MATRGALFGRWAVLWIGLAVALGAALLVVRLSADHDRQLRLVFEVDKLAMADLLSDVARRSIERYTPDFLESTANLILLGSAMHVEVVLGEAVLFERSDGDWQLAALPAASAELPQRSARWESTFVDVVVPWDTVDATGRTNGYVRVAFPTTAVTQRGRAFLLRNAGIAAGFVLAAVVGSALLLRRSRRGSAGQGDESMLQCGDLVVDLSRKSVSLAGREVRLTPKQFALMVLFARDPAHVYSDAEIVRALWPTSPYADSNDVKQCVYSLRRQLARVHPEPSRVVLNVRGHGYRLGIADVEDDLTSR